MICVLLLSFSDYVLALSVSYVPETGTPPPPRQKTVIAYDSYDNKAYIYGGRSNVIHDDIWEFDLNTKTWLEIHPPNGLKPGKRSSSYLVMLEKSREILLFGGDTEVGPISDVWLYDIGSETVILTQWKLVDVKGKPPPRGSYRGICDYTHEGKHYLAVYGGVGKFGDIQSLYT